MTILETLTKEGRITILEPKMNVEIWVPTGRVDDVLSDLTVMRGVDLSSTSRQSIKYASRTGGCVIV